MGRGSIPSHLRSDLPVPGYVRCPGCSLGEPWWGELRAGILQLPASGFIEGCTEFVAHSWGADMLNAGSQGKSCLMVKIIKILCHVTSATIFVILASWQLFHCGHHGPEEVEGCLMLRIQEAEATMRQRSL